MVNYNYIGKNIAFITISFAIMVICAIYTYNNRYYLRFIPLPLEFANIVNKDSYLLPSSQAATPNGRGDLSSADITTEAGLRTALNHIQSMSPVENVIGMPDYTGVTFEKWMKEVTTKPFFCTDATQLFILTAWQQGLRAREWHLLPEGWPPGAGHSVAEFYNPRSEQWILVDAQHAAIVRGPDGAPANMLQVLRAFAAKRQADITIDYGEYREAMLRGARGASVEQYFFQNGLLRTPVLQLRQATWLAEVPKNYGFSGHFVIAYPILVDGWTHDNRIWLSKISALFTCAFGLLTVIALFKRFRHPASS